MGTPRETRDGILACVGVRPLHMQRAVASCYALASVQARVSQRSVWRVLVVHQPVVGRALPRAFLDRAGDVCRWQHVRERKKNELSLGFSVSLFNSLNTQQLLFGFLLCAVGAPSPVPTKTFLHPSRRLSHTPVHLCVPFVSFPWRAYTNTGSAKKTCGVDVVSKSFLRSVSSLMLLST